MGPMSEFSRRLFATAALLIGVATVGAAPSMRCHVCAGRLSEQYWTYENKICCSEACVDLLRPRCARCEKVIDGKYVESEGAVYCGQNCFNTTLPDCEICNEPIYEGFNITSHNYCQRCVERSPTCFCCGLPAAYPTQLDDGREICVNCARWAVRDEALAQQHYDRARRWLEAWTSLTIGSVPDLKLVDRDEMMKLSTDLRKSDSPVPIRGLYSRQTYLRKRGFFGAWRESPKDSRETIYLIDHLHDEVFRVAATHELTHDLIHEHFKRLEDAPLWVHEGLCQQAAAEYCRRRNYADALQSIEICTDPDYGDGYQYFKRVAGFEGWSALKRWMETVDVETLPETAPKP